MKKLLTVAAGLAAGLMVIVVFALTVQWLFFGSSTSINIFNRSNMLLHDVAVTVPGSSPFSGRPSDMGPGVSSVFSTDTHMLFPVRVTFRANGHAYEVERRVWLPPIGAYIISIYIDPEMRVSVVPRIIW